MTVLPDKAGADQLEVRLGEAEKVLSEYVGRLEAEEKERKDLQELLEAFMWQHRQQLKDAKKKLKVSLPRHCSLLENVKPTTAIALSSSK